MSFKIMFDISFIKVQVYTPYFSLYAEKGMTIWRGSIKYSKICEEENQIMKTKTI